MLLLQQMLVLFIYMMVGYFTYKKGIFDSEMGKKISWLVVNIANPMMILSSAVNGEGEIRGQELILTAVIAIIMYILLILLAELVPVMFRLRKEERGYFKLMTVFNNIGFMGFPVISAVYGSGALLYAAVFQLPFNILFYTYGIVMVSRNGEGKFNWREMINVGIVSSIIAVILYLVEIPVPQFFKATAQGFSNLTAPLSMMVIGISLAKIRLKDMFLDVRMLLFAGMKLLLVPIFGMILVCRFVEIEALRGVCMVMLATPAASMTAMLAQQSGENYEEVAKGVALTTLLSVITIPIVSAVVL